MTPGANDVAPWPLWHRLTRAAAVALALALPVAVLAWLVRAEADVVVDLDQQAVAAATAPPRDSPTLRRALLLWEEAFQARWVNLAGAVLLVWLWRSRPELRRRIVWGAGTVLVGWGLANLLKLVVGRARPAVADALAQAPGYSFPSGHAMNTTVAAVALTAVVWPLLGPRARVALPIAAGAAVVLTGVDRVMLGVHHPSDVVAGVLLGGAVVAGSSVGWRTGAAA